MDDEIVRFLVTTDNHLGYYERDPIRGNDSLASFEEALEVAKQKKVDFILLAGDLFNENKPSRRILHNTMELLRTYCLGNNPIYFEILNDQKELFKSNLGKVNYEDPYQSIELPIFSIHGNHDDPSRDGGGGEALAALDLLAVSNLVNYFGKASHVEDIEITPILIKKRNTKIAIYGLGAIRDERLNRMWNLKKVKFIRLTVEQGRDEYFNIFILHQNRDYGRGRKNCIHESMIPEWMDLVIWGNEHECQPQLVESLVGTYRLLQPGSSIACSLSKTESAEFPKNMMYFEVKERKFRMKSIPFTEIRPFIYSEITLKDEKSLDPNHPKIEEKIQDFLSLKVHNMIAEARKLLVNYPLTGVSRKFRLFEPSKVLIRLKVDHDDFPAINHQRFGGQFINEVSNPSELILLSKKRKDYFKPGDPNNNSIQGELRQLIAEGDEEEIYKIKIEDLVNETLASNRNSLSILAETDMAKALDDYIMRKVTNAIQDLVFSSLEKTQSKFYSDKAIKDKSAILEITSKEKNIPVKSLSSLSKLLASQPETPLVFDESGDEAEADFKDTKKDSKPSRGRKATKISDTKEPTRKNTTRQAKSSNSRKKDSDSELSFEDESNRKSSMKTSKKGQKMDYSDDEFLDEESEVEEISSVDNEKVFDAPKKKAPTKTINSNPKGRKKASIPDSPLIDLIEPQINSDVKATPISISKPDVASTSGPRKRQLPLSFSQVSSKSSMKSKVDINNDWG